MWGYGFSLSLIWHPTTFIFNTLLSWCCVCERWIFSWFLLYFSRLFFFQSRKRGTCSEFVSQCSPHETETIWASGGMRQGKVDLLLFQSSTDPQRLAAQPQYLPPHSCAVPSTVHVHASLIVYSRYSFGFTSSLTVTAARADRNVVT